ncbi:MAG: protoheme IX farnesyltransferase [Oceanicaulis sp.]
MTEDEFKPTVKLTPEQESARNKRNAAIAFGLVAFVVLIFLTTVVQMTSNWNAGVSG